MSLHQLLHMSQDLVRFFNILLAGLLAGSVFVIWAGYDPSAYPYETYVDQQQGAIRGLNTLMPLMGFSTLLLTALSAYQQRDNRPVLITLVIAMVFMVGSALTTRFGNQPINAVVMTWDKASPPQDWTILRDQWWSYHCLRAITTFCGFALVIWSALRRAG